MKNLKKLPSANEICFFAWQRQIIEAANKPWVASVMLHRAKWLQFRTAWLIRWLKRQPRIVRRYLQAKLGTTLVGAALLLALSQVSIQASSIVVDNGAVDIAGDGFCSLVEAIENANDTVTGQPHADCLSGNPVGADTIVLPSGGVFTLTAVHNYAYESNNGLPLISSEVTIAGNGSTIVRDSNAPEFRIMAVTESGDLTLNAATISGGQASTDEGDGGGLFSYYGSLEVVDCTISGNSAHVGGGIYSEIGDINIHESTITANSAHWGGGLTIRSRYGNSVAEISNSTIFGNTANAAGGMSLIYGVMEIRNSTITGNSSGIVGGIYNFEGHMTLERSIISGNMSEDSLTREMDNYGSVIRDNYNIFGFSGDDGVNFTPGVTDIVPAEAIADILDTTLQNNGGPTETIALVSGSPAIDASPDDGDCPGIDQRGVTRPQGLACDIGAFEAEFTELVVEIDIKPGSENNLFRCRGNTEIPVAILTNDGFNALDVDHTTVTFAGANEIHRNPVTGVPARHEKDVDRDGDLDLIFHFRLGDTNLDCDATEGSLLGETVDGQAITGTDNLILTGPRR
ncbi:MAG: hypothetical protein GY943_18065 [Chloroflexi bacterium]|nr:hypothetical protein [Chloroflexota bacterium]